MINKSNNYTYVSLTMTSVEEKQQILLVFAIDISGSMVNNYLNPFKWDRTKDALASFIKNQKKSNPLAVVDIFTFNSKVNVLYKRTPILEINDFLKDINPEGGTSLNDTIVDMNNEMEETIKDMRVFEIILTDGEDTTSKSSPATVRDRITKLQEDGIEFIFLGAGMDSFKTAANYGIAYATNVSLDDNAPDNIGNVTKSLSDNINQLVRTNSTIANCPELVRAYTEPCYGAHVDKKNKMKFLDIPGNTPALKRCPSLSPPAQSCIQQPPRGFRGVPLTRHVQITQYDENDENDEQEVPRLPPLLQLHSAMNVTSTNNDWYINVPSLTRS